MADDSMSASSYDGQSSSSADEECPQFAQNCKAEVGRWTNRMTDWRNDEAFLVGNHVRCPCCPFKEFSRFEHFPPHFKKYHEDTPVGTVLTKSVLRLAQAKHNWNQISGKVSELFNRHPPMEDSPNLLHESAQLLADQLRRSPSWQAEEPGLHKVSTMLDSRITLLLDVDDTRFIFKNDMDQYHRISDQYVCSDRHLSTFLACLLHPHTKGAHERVLAMIKSKCGWIGYLHPQDKPILQTLCEKILSHPVLVELLSKCRQRADKRVVGIDATYSALLSVLWQTPHGKAHDPSYAEQVPELHALLTVQCLDSVLLTWPCPSEAFEHQAKAHTQSFP